MVYYSVNLWTAEAINDNLGLNFYVYTLRL